MFGHRKCFYYSSIFLIWKNDSQSRAIVIIRLQDFELPNPPISDGHPLFHDEYKRNTIVQRELKCEYALVCIIIDYVSWHITHYA